MSSVTNTNTDRKHPWFSRLREHCARGHITPFCASFGLGVGPPHTSQETRLRTTVHACPRDRALLANPRVKISVPSAALPTTRKTRGILGTVKRSNALNDSQRRVPKCTVSVETRVGHLIQWEATDAFNKITSAFCRI